MGFAALDETDAWREIKDRWSHGGAERGADVALNAGRMRLA